MSWQPSGQFNFLQRRAETIQAIRHFFIERGLLEVETPLLCQHTVTDPFIDSFQVGNRYLQTSPEYAMKRLLAAGSGPIFQICKAFRQEESGHQHNSEFTLLEWYQPGYNHFDLIKEVDALLQFILTSPPANIITYQACFESYFNFNPHTVSHHEIMTIAQQHLNLNHIEQYSKTTLLQLLMAKKIEPHLGFKQPTFVIDYPIEQAALARCTEGNNPIAERFELYINGVELANGFHELNDPVQQRERFNQDLILRQQLNKTIPTIDERFIASLETLPNCAGVALGIDRLIMQQCDCTQINKVISFAWGQA